MMRRTALAMLGIAAVAVLSLAIWHSPARHHPSRPKLLSEAEILRRLPSASPRRVLDYYLWGVNHRSSKVVSACAPHPGGFRTLPIHTRRWEVISICEVTGSGLRSVRRKLQRSDNREYRVRIVYHGAAWGIPGDPPVFVDGRNLPLTFVVQRDTTGRRWHITSIGF